MTKEQNAELQTLLFKRQLDGKETNRFRKLRAQSNREQAEAESLDLWTIWTQLCQSAQKTEPELYSRALKIEHVLLFHINGHIGD